MAVRCKPRGHFCYWCDTLLSGFSWSCCDGVCWLGESICNVLHGSHKELLVSKYLCIGFSHQVIILLGFQLIKCGIGVGDPDSLEWLGAWGCRIGQSIG